MSIRRTSNRSSQDTGFYNPEFFADVGSRIAYSISPDPDAEAYLLAVQTADGEALEPSVVNAVTNFVVGCKSDGIWNAIKASCILAGARTLNGALVPLVGTAPTNNNFVSGDYSRTTGLVGDGSTKYLDSNRSNNADPQNNQHVAVYQTALGTIVSGRLLSGRDPSTSTGSTQLSDVDGSLANVEGYSRYSGTIWSITRANAPKFFGLSRSSSSSYTVRQASINTIRNDSSAAPNSTSITIFSNPAPNSHTNARLAFYSIGESLDLALLDNRVTRLVNEIAFFLNTGLDGGGYNINTLKYVNAGYAAGGSLS